MVATGTVGFLRSIHRPAVPVGLHNMTINDTVIRAACETFTRAECVAKRAAALSALEKGAAIVSVSTGSGTAYSRQVQVTPAEAVEFWQKCIDYLDMQAGAVVPDDGRRVGLIFTGNEAC